ncbi:MAG: hypothetical protein ABI435_01295 [Pseudolysinimonas sp.]
MRTTGDELLGNDNEWFAVCYFYSAYHLIKAALIRDPIFDSPTGLSRIDVNLTMAHRWATHHQGRIQNGSRDPGINDIVVKLYNGISIEYRRLHLASIGVRYSDGLGVISPQTAAQDYSVIAAAHARGGIRYSV